jgi:plastocyanin
MKTTSLVFTAALAASLATAAAADITGKITLKGTPPPEKELPLDVMCGKLWEGKSKPTTRFYVVNGGALADVTVSLKELTGKSAGASAGPVIIDQVGCEYVPYVTAAQTGQKITVKNSDPVLHNVHPTPVNTAGGNKEANKAQMPKGADLHFEFPAPEPWLRFKCDVHPWMFSYVSIFDHPYFAVTGKDGTFAIKNVPDGKYTLVVAHRKAGTVEKAIEVKGGNVTADFELEAK